MTLYEALELSQTASPEMIRAAWKTLGARYHPDNLDTGDEERFKAVSAAYEILRDPQKRAQYDATLITDRVRPSADYRQPQTARAWANGRGWVDIDPSELGRYPNAEFRTPYGQPYPNAYGGVEQAEMTQDEIYDAVMHVAANVGDYALQQMIEALPLGLRAMVREYVRTRQR